MKTRIANQKISLNGVLFIMNVILMNLSVEAMAQEQDSTKSLFGSNVKVSEIWTPEVKINSIQGDVGTLIGFYGGAVFNRTILLGISGGANLSHPTVNYGYFGAVGQYIYRQIFGIAADKYCWHMDQQRTMRTKSQDCLIISVTFQEPASF
jgi:hypothetical protein